MPPRTLLATTTGEPYQPVRLTYQVPAKVFALGRLRGLRCVGEDRDTRLLCLWLVDEALALPLGGMSPGKEVADAGRRVILGTFRFPDAKRMTLEVRSIARAIELARLLRPRLGPEVVLTRARIVNRWFEAREAELDDLGALDNWLDRGVTVIDPQVTAREMEAVLAAAPQSDKLAAYMRWNDSRKHLDVPLVEDFPLCPEEETEEFRDLKMTLNFRFLRASRHWTGERVTLRQVIEEAVASTKG